MQKQSGGPSQLVTAVMQGESDNALYWTCMYLHDSKHSQLEDAWIEIIARIGARPVMPHKETWLHTITVVLNIIHAEELHIGDALVTTGMLMLLNQRIVNGSSSGKNGGTHFATLRKEILDYFPEGALLSFRGQQQFARILPALASSTYPFVNRVLAGFGRLVEQEDIVNTHRALEYISRKKLQVPMPNVWPAPSPEIADKGDPVWLLWGGMLQLFPQNEHVERMWRMYCHQWRPGVKPGRAGLLWGVAHLMQQGVGMTWTKEETMVLERVRKVAPELWASIREVEGASEQSERNTPAPDVLDSYIPRCKYQPTSVATNPTAAEPKMLRIKGCNQKLDNKYESQQPSSGSDPRHRWIYFGTKGQ